MIWKKHKEASGAGNDVYLDLRGGYIRVFTLWKGTELHSYDWCSFLLMGHTSFKSLFYDKME